MKNPLLARRAPWVADSEILILNEKHYRLVPADQISSEDLEKMKLLK